MGTVLEHSAERYGALIVVGRSSATFSEHTFADVLVEHAMRAPIVGDAEVSRIRRCLLMASNRPMDQDAYRRVL